MAAHHRQNTAGRRKVQVWRPGSAALATLLSGRVPPRAGGRLGPQPVGFDGRRMAGRGAAARGVGPRRQRPEVVAGGLGARASRAAAGNRRPGEPPSRGTGPAAAPWACCPLICLCSQPPSSGTAGTRRRRPRGARGWVRPGSEGPCGGVAWPGRTWVLCAGGNDSFPSFAVSFASLFPILTMHLQSSFLVLVSLTSGSPVMSSLTHTVGALGFPTSLWIGVRLSFACCLLCWG